jgi:hypothetical protein
LKATTDQPSVLEPHFTAGWFAELWGVDPKTVLRWFQDRDDVLRLQKPKKGARVEIRIPFSVAMRVYHEKTRCR